MEGLTAATDKLTCRAETLTFAFKLAMAKLPQQPQAPPVKSLQININSEDDAKAVIQHLQEIKRNWDTMHAAGLVDSIEFCIMEPVRRKVDSLLMGAVRWCRTYIKQVKPFEGNVFFSLPHYQPPSVQVTRSSDATTEETTAKPEKVNRYLKNLTPEQIGQAQEKLAQTQTPGKTQRPVTADMPGA